jgi:diguanylate cyclase (GGDEF)-like protein/PAS domain S-box-containing protein
MGATTTVNERPAEEPKSEPTLRASHAFLSTTARIAHLGGWNLNLRNGELRWSDETCLTFGRDPKVYRPTLEDFWGAVHPDDRERVRSALDAAATRGEPCDIEFRIVRPDGCERVLHAKAEVTRGADGQPEVMTGAAHDVTEQRAVERDLRFANALSMAQLESSPDGILVVGANRRIVSFNRKFVELWKIPEAIVETRSDERAVAWVLDSLAAPAAFLTRLDELYANPDAHSEEEIELKDGRVFERHSSPLPIAIDEGVGRIFFFRDISARKAAQERLARVAREDALTGLPNRTVFVEAVQQAMARAARGAKGFALLYLDLDHFKDVNDTLGHPAGDTLLRMVAERLRAEVRQPDIAARFGGDEFAVIESDVTDPGEAAALAERLQSALREPFPILGNEIRIGASIGIALHGPRVDGPEMLLSQSDLALYRAKADGRGTYRFFAEGMDADVRARVALVSELRAAIEAEQMFLVYQPQVEISTGRIVGLEALVRWRHPHRGIVSPGTFIPVAEKSGLIVPLGRWVMRHACQQAKAWVDAGICPDVVAVNISGSQFRTPFELETTLASILAETGLPPQRLEVELTESVLMGAWLEQNEVLVRLRESGVKIAIDDFGTGFSSLQYLSRFPVDRLKIAQEFMLDLRQGRGNAAIVRATIGLARELGLDVIAEGIETSEQFDLLEGWGCREVQGYYFAKPMPAAEVEELLRKGTIEPRASRRPQSRPTDRPRSAVSRLSASGGRS